MSNGEETKEMLDRIEAEILDVKRQYDLFFQGIRRQEPSEARRTVEESVRKIGQRKITNSNDQFRFNNLQSRFYSYSNLWNRTVRELEEGRLVRDHSGVLVRVSPRQMNAVDPSHLEFVLKELLSARRKCGLSADTRDLSLARETLLVRAREISGSHGGKQVEFRISVEDGKPKVKAVVR